MDVDIQPDYLPTSDEYEAQAKYEAMIDDLSIIIYRSCISVIESLDCGEEIGDWLWNSVTSVKLQMAHILGNIPASCTLKCDYFENAVICFEKAASMVVDNFDVNVVSISFITARMCAYRAINGTDEP